MKKDKNPSVNQKKKTCTSGAFILNVRYIYKKKETPCVCKKYFYPFT